jgi:hypothetical protein
VAQEIELIVQIPRGSSVDLQLRAEPPASVADGRVMLEHLPAGADGRLSAPRVGEVVLTVPSPEALGREPDAVRHAISGAAGAGEPIVVLVEGAEYLRDDELAAVLEAAAHTSRPVILQIMEGA